MMWLLTTRCGWEGWPVPYSIRAVNVRRLSHRERRVDRPVDRVVSCEITLKRTCATSSMVSPRKASHPGARSRRARTLPGRPRAGWYWGMLRRFADGDDLARGPLPTLTYEQILKWADSHHERTGTWPITSSGEIPSADCPAESWLAVEAALGLGLRGLPGGDTLARLLDRERGKLNRLELPRFSEHQILQWADEYHRRTGDWPSGSTEGEIPGSRGATWQNVQNALHAGCRGLPGGSTLGRLLAEHRGVRNRGEPERLRINEILSWARSHHRRTGRWPKDDSGGVAEAPGETWSGVNAALQSGLRGLRGGTTLPRLLARYAGVRNHMDLPVLTIEKVLAWADAHRSRTGRWPVIGSGRIEGERWECWRSVDRALRTCSRGLQRKTSLARLLARERGARLVKELGRLPVARILAWADAHHQRTGRWPIAESGAILEAPEEGWVGVDLALRVGRRGLSGGSSLAQLLAKFRGVRNRLDPPRLKPDLILRWARAHLERTGKWPSRNTGEVVGVPGETWCAVEKALLTGRRGLPGGRTLSWFLAEHGAPTRAPKPRLGLEWVLSRARSHHDCFGSWPRSDSGAVVDSPGETWSAVDLALRRGHRGLPGGSSVARLLHAELGVPTRAAKPRLTIAWIVSRARRHRDRSGNWPRSNSGSIVGAPGENWSAVDQALARGYRGLPGGSSLARLLEQEVPEPPARSRRPNRPARASALLK